MWLCIDFTRYVLTYFFLQYNCVRIDSVALRAAQHFPQVANYGEVFCENGKVYYAHLPLFPAAITRFFYFAPFSAISEAIIFLFLGMAIFLTDHEVHYGFILWTLLLCLVSRFMCKCVAYFTTQKTLKKVAQSQPCFC